MSTRKVNLKAAEALESASRNAVQVIVGCDACVDRIYRVVREWNGDSPTYVFDMDEMSELLRDAEKEHAGNSDADLAEERMGGCSALLSRAMGAQGFPVMAVGFYGPSGSPDLIFNPLTQMKNVQVVSLPGRVPETVCLEFALGKYMLNMGRREMRAITYDVIAKALRERLGGLEKVRQFMSTVGGYALVNWAETPKMGEIWDGLATLVPMIRSDRPPMFLDLAEPGKRAPELPEALRTIRKLQQHSRVILSMNGKEIRKVFAALEMEYPSIAPDWEAARVACEMIRRELELSMVVCHLSTSQAGSWGVEYGHGREGSAGFDGFGASRTVTTVGAGDHWGGGFFGAILRGLHPELALQVGGATSGFYVRHGRSPSLHEVAEFLAMWKFQAFSLEWADAA